MCIGDGHTRHSSSAVAAAALQLPLCGAASRKNSEQREITTFTMGQQLSSTCGWETAEERAARLAAEAEATEKAWKQLASVIGETGGMFGRGGREYGTPAETFVQGLRDGDPKFAVLKPGRGKQDDEPIGDAGVQVIAVMLSECPALTKLDLGENAITDAGAEALAKALPQCDTLKELALHENQISDVGVAALAKALPKCKALSVLQLQGNKIGDAGAQALAHAFGNISLGELYLAHNLIGDAGALVLAGALSQSALTVINLQGNEYTKQAGPAWGNYRSVEAKLTNLDLKSFQLKRGEEDYVNYKNKNGQGVKVSAGP